MKKVLVIGIIVVLLVGTIGITTWARGGGGGRNFGVGGMGGGLQKGLNLTADQQSKILAIQQEFQKETLSLRQELQKKQLELRQLWNANPINQAAVDAKNKEITALRTQLVQKSREMMEKVKKVLTAEQIKQLESFQGNGGFGMGLGRGQMGCGGNMRGCGACGATGA